MLDHRGFTVADITRSNAFRDAALATYGAVVFDPDGDDIEAACHKPA